MNSLIETIVFSFLIVCVLLGMEKVILHIINHFPVNKKTLKLNVSEDSKKVKKHLIGLEEKAAADKISRTPIIELIPKNEAQFESTLNLMERMNKDKYYKYPSSNIGVFIRSTEGCLNSNLADWEKKFNAASPAYEKDMTKLRYELSIFINSSSVNYGFGEATLESLITLFSRFVKDTTDGTIEEKNRMVFSPIDGDAPPLFTQIEKQFMEASKAGLLERFNESERIDNIRSLLGTVSRSHAIYNNVKGEKLRSESELKAFNIFLGKKNDLKDLIAKEEETEQLKLGILKPEDESK